jgi:hypothetical protein
MAERPRQSKGRDPRLVKLTIQTSRCTQAYTLSGKKKEGSAAPKPVTLPKLKCLEQEPLDE